MGALPRGTVRGLVRPDLTRDFPTGNESVAQGRPDRGLEGHLSDLVRGRQRSARPGAIHGPDETKSLPGRHSRDGNGRLITESIPARKRGQADATVAAVG